MCRFLLKYNKIERGKNENETFSNIINFNPIIFIGCDEDSITDVLLGSNSVTLSGDINKSFDAVSLAGMVYEFSTFSFVLVMQPEDSDPNSFEDYFTLIKQSDVLPTVGNYNIEYNGYGLNLSDDFVGYYAANDTTMYFMHSGSVNITESNTLKIAGTFDISGYYFFLVPDSTRELKITGKFSTIPVELD